MRNKRLKVGIIQKTIPHYRIDFFDELCRQMPDLCIYHSTSLSSDGLVDTTRFSFPNKYLKIIETKYFIYQRLLIEFIKRKYDYIVLGLELKISSNILLWFMCIFMRTKIIWWTHGFNVHLRERNMWYSIDRLIKTVFMKFSHKILLYTDYNFDELIKKGIPATKIIILNNALNEEAYKKSLLNVTDIDLRKVENETKKSKHTITFIGRLKKNKNLKMFIDIADNLRTKFYDLRAFVIGSGPERANLESYVKQKRLQDCVFFQGTINDPTALSPYLASTDFIVDTGAVGLSIVHSFIYGIPFVTLGDAAHSPEIVYLTSDFNGYIAHDISELCEWISDTFKNCDKMNRLRQNCLLTISDKVNFTSMVEKFVSSIP